MSNPDETVQHRQRRSLGRAGGSFARGPHERAVLHAEVRRLVRALRPYRVLPREALEREAKASRWHEAGFEHALQAAVNEGKIAELPLGFYGLPRTDRTCAGDGDGSGDAT